MKHVGGVCGGRIPSRRPSDLDFFMAPACFHQFLLHNTRTLKCTHAETEINNKTLKTGINITLQIRLCRSLHRLAKLDTCWVRLFFLYYTRLNHAANCPWGGCSPKLPAHGAHCSSQRSEFKD